MDTDEHGSEEMGEHARIDLSIEQAVRIAMAHADAEPIPMPDYRWVLNAPRQLRDGWYFTRRSAHIGHVSPDENGGYTDAPGFVVSFHDGLIRPIGLREYIARHAEIRSAPTSGPPLF